MTTSKRFDPYLLHNLDSVDRDSSTTYVRSYLGKRLSAILTDGRVITGMFVALDHAGNLYLSHVTEKYPFHKRMIANVICHLDFVDSLELRE
jgi:small nuclear ribonucleoprotein (snRNP)-like protein